MPFRSDEHTSAASFLESIGLKRFPDVSGLKNGNALRAWNAADEMLLDEFFQPCQTPVASDYSAKPLILNDHFGALATALAEQPLISINDSFSSLHAAKQNFERRQRSESRQLTSPDFRHALDYPADRADCVLMQVPKSLALLEDQLYRIRANVDEETRVIAGAMTRNIHRSTLDLFEKILGPTRTSLARKKARLIFCQPDPARWTGESPYPDCYALENPAINLMNHASVFSRKRLDIGTRLLLEQLDQLPPASEIIDLGCGNGIIGICARQRQPSCRVGFYDDSYMAIASARLNHDACFADESAEYHWQFCLDGRAANSCDLILTNPPFHQQHSIESEVAWTMFKQSRPALTKNGELWVVGNRHLNYHRKIKHLFGNCEVVSSNSKFVVLRARK